MEEDKSQNKTTHQETSSAEGATSPESPILLTDALRAINQAAAELPPPTETVVEVSESSAPLIRMANAILSTAIDSRASAIQCEPDRRNLRVRIRIDGDLHEMMAIPKHIGPPLLRRYLIMADLNPFSQKPQVGYIPIKHTNQAYTLRLSTIPSLHGVSQVLKIYNESMATLGVNKLGMMPTVQTNVEEVLTVPGLFLVVGPTDSGRTTTAYRLVQALNTLERNTLSVEEMPGYRLSGVTQTYTSQMRGMSHAEAIASARNLIPNVLFVGDITSREAANEAVSAAESGITVIANLGAPDAIGGILMLMRLGISPDRIAGVVTSILAQRLVRLLCTHCREASGTEIPGHLFYQLPNIYRFPDSSGQRPTHFYRASGCDACKNRGYWNRLGLFELLRMDTRLRDTLWGTVTPSRLREAVRMSGMQSLSSLAWEWATVGLISMEEASKVQAGLPNS